MTIAEQILFIAAGLKGWASSNKGDVHVASDVVELIDLLRQRPGAPRVGVMFQEELPRGDFYELGRVERTFKLVVARGRGLVLETGASLTQGAAGGKPMYQLVEETRETMRALRFDSEFCESVPVYKGSKPFEVQGVVLDAFEINFSVGCQLPQMSEVDVSVGEGVEA